MEIVSIEKRTFEAMVARFDRFVSRMEAICQRHGEKTMSEWMDNQDVCRMLNISPRTLQTLRDNGTHDEESGHPAQPALRSHFQ